MYGSDDSGSKNSLRLSFICFITVKTWAATFLKGIVFSFNSFSSVDIALLIIFLVRLLFRSQRWLITYHPITLLPDPEAAAIPTAPNPDSGTSTTTQTNDNDENTGNKIFWRRAFYLRSLFIFLFCKYWHIKDAEMLFLALFSGQESDIISTVTPSGSGGSTAYRDETPASKQNFL